MMAIAQVGALAAMLCGLVGMTLSGCRRGEPLSSPVPAPAPSLELVWQRQRFALEERDVPGLLADCSRSIDSTVWVEDEHGATKASGGGYQNVDKAYGGVVRSLDGAPRVAARVDHKTKPPIIFSIWSGSGVDFASVVSVFDDQSKIIYHFSYILKTSIGSGPPAQMSIGSGPYALDTDDAHTKASVEPHQSMEQRWLHRDIDSLMALYREESKVLYFDAEEVFHVSRGLAEIRKFFENTNLTVPYIQPKSAVSAHSDERDICSTWVSGFHGDGARRLSMLIYAAGGADYRNCSSWIQLQVMGYFPGNESQAPSFLP